jgi:hypothetical protein
MEKESSACLRNKLKQQNSYTLNIQANLPYISGFPTVNKLFSFLQTTIASKLIVRNVIFLIYAFEN